MTKQKASRMHSAHNHVHKSSHNEQHDNHAQKHTSDHHEKHNQGLVDDYKKGLLGIDQSEAKYDRLFEQKLSQQYREFRNIKEHKILTKKFYRILVVLLVITLMALLLISFRGAP